MSRWSCHAGETPLPQEPDGNDHSMPDWIIPVIKRVKRAAFGFTNFANYRIRALLYAGKPNWALLDTLTPT